MCCLGVFCNCSILLHSSSIKEVVWVEIVFYMSQKYCPGKDRGAPKMSSDGMQPKSSLTVFLTERKINLPSS